MDLLAHILYGATVCSRSGLAGGRTGAVDSTGRRVGWARDRTVWAAAGFGLLPDLAAMGLPFLWWWVTRSDGNFFHRFDGAGIEIYRYCHSLIVAGLGCLFIGWRRRRLAAPALAYPLHLLMDAISHGLGKFQTTLFYPLTDWGYDGIRWWEHFGFFVAYWGVLPALWLGLWAWRRRAR